MKTLSSLVRAVDYSFKHHANKFEDIRFLEPILSYYEGEDWRKFVRFSKECYSRIFVVRREDLEILLLCWKPGQGSPIHNHPNRGCLLRVLQGNLREERFDSEQTLVTQLEEHRISYIDNQMGVHRIVNAATENAVSLHIYSPGFFVPQKSDCIEDFDKAEILGT